MDPEKFTSEIQSWMLESGAVQVSVVLKSPVTIILKFTVVTICTIVRVKCKMPCQSNIK